MHISETVRFLISGGAATCIHFAVLAFSIEVLMIHSAGVANLCAASVGLTAAYLGNRYFVFSHVTGSNKVLGSRFLIAYICLAGLHGLSLFILTDVANVDYRLSFLMVTVFVTIASFIANKKMVFRSEL